MWRAGFCARNFLLWFSCKKICVVNCNFEKNVANVRAENPRHDSRASRTFAAEIVAARNPKACEKFVC